MDTWVVSTFMDIMNNRNIYIQVFMRTCFHFSQIYTRHRTPRSCGNSTFNILMNHQTVFQSGQPYHFIFSPTSVQGVQFLYILANTSYSQSFDYSHHSGCELAAHWLFKIVVV